MSDTPNRQRKTTAPTLTPDKEDHVWHLYLKAMPKAQIAREVGCSRPTVTKIVKRILEELSAGRREDLEQERSRSLSEYDAVKREAWQRLECVSATSTTAVGYLSAILNARQAQDRLLGLEKQTVNHRVAVLARIDALLDAGVPIALPGADDV